MSSVGCYLYGFTERGFRAAPGLRGLADSPVHLVAFGELAAVVSRHPVQRLPPSRRNVEPHHRVVRRICDEGALVPAAFGHISESESAIVDVLRGNYDEIREELDRLRDRSEMSLRIAWTVPNIFDHLVRTNRDLRELRDRVFRRGGLVSMSDRLEVGSAFEATLTRERERLSALALDAFASVALEVLPNAPRDEKTICHASLLVARGRLDAFQAALHAAATRFDASHTFETSGPWPPYSFVRLRLQTSRAA